MILSGGTPNLSITPSLSRRVSVIVLTRVTWSETSWAMSLSPVEMSVVIFRFAAEAEDDPLEFYGAGLERLIVGLTLPLTALVIGTAALGQDLEDGTATYLLSKPIPRWRIVIEKAAAACPIVENVDAARTVPPLFRTYLRYGAKVCGPPAIDRDFKTIDYLVALDVDALSRGSFKLFFG